MTSEFFKYHCIGFEIGPKLRPTDGRAVPELSMLIQRWREGASRESSQNLEVLFNVNEHLTSCVRMDTSV